MVKYSVLNGIQLNKSDNEAVIIESPVNPHKLTKTLTFGNVQKIINPGPVIRPIEPKRKRIHKQVSKSVINVNKERKRL